MVADLSAAFVALDESHSDSKQFIDILLLLAAISHLLFESVMMKLFDYLYQKQMGPETVGCPIVRR